MLYKPIDIAEVKVRLEELIEEVRCRHAHYVIMANGVPVADLAPSGEAQRKRRLVRGVGSVLAQIEEGPPEQRFRDKYKSLAWSNSKACDDTLIAQALMKGKRPVRDVLTEIDVFNAHVDRRAASAPNYWLDRTLPTG